MSTLLEQLIEAKICAALAAVITARPVVGFWQPAPEGEVKSRPRSCLEVTVKPRACEGWGSDIRAFRVVIAIESAGEDDATGATIPADYAAAVGVLEKWQGEDNDATATALSVSGFDAQGFNFADGGDCGLDPQTAVWFAVIQCEIKGCTVEVVPETPEE